jgi:hypothetical protein
VTLDQISGLFDAGEAFVEGTIAAVLVVLWVAVLGLHMARPLMVRTTGKFTLRLGADLWWIIYIGLRDILTINVFLGSFIFLYPDVVKGQELPITGGIAGVCAFAAALIKLMTRNDADRKWFTVQVLLLALGATLYVGPYILGSQMTMLTGQRIDQIMPFLVSSKNPDLALALCYLSALLAGILGLIAVVYNFRLTSIRRPEPGPAGVAR